VGTDLGLSLKLPIPRNSREIVCTIVEIPRFQEYTAVASMLAQHGVRFVEMAENSEITLSVLAPQSWHYDGSVARQLFSMPVLTRPYGSASCSLVAFRRSILEGIHSDGVMVEHVYDY